MWIWSVLNWNTLQTKGSAFAGRSLASCKMNKSVFREMFLRKLVHQSVSCHITLKFEEHCRNCFGVKMNLKQKEHMNIISDYFLLNN